MRKLVVLSVGVGCLVMLSGGVGAADEDNKVPAGRVVWQLAGKTLLNPVTGAGQVLAYFTFIDGVSDPMFSGPTAAATAHFTLRSQPFQTQFIPHGDILIGLLGTETFSLYVDSTPDQDFNNPASFSDGHELASFNRLPAQINFVGPVFTDTFSVEFLASHRVPWTDRVIDLRQLTPNGVTLAITGSTAAQPTTLPEYPVSVSFGASAVAIGLGSKQ
ncbi:MAG: hypothetical protein WBC51_05455 [Vicinamibacterales bacterium]